MIGWPDLVIVILPALLSAIFVHVVLVRAGFRSFLGIRVGAIVAALFTAHLSILGSFAVGWSTDSTLAMIGVLFVAAFLPSAMILAIALVARAILFAGKNVVVEEEHK
ncbi:hypothetical protein [Aurantiacibacter sp. MUD61]|uniref:hypothetical protein n=1 Tax=Aurantiacibacter sp. MUD61 TaxID=3009083 RepID=UPI0022F12662|nr:hypothetical protein [Aurantiacibacter sp. MUD61]